MKTEVKRWGNSAAVRLPSKMLAAAHLDISSSISVSVKGRKIVIEAIAEQPAKYLKLPFSEQSLLKGLNAETAHSDELATISSKEIGD